MSLESICDLRLLPNEVIDIIGEYLDDCLSNSKKFASLRKIRFTLYTEIISDKYIFSSEYISFTQRLIEKGIKEFATNKNVLNTCVDEQIYFMHRSFRIMRKCLLLLERYIVEYKKIYTELPEIGYAEMNSNEVQYKYPIPKSSYKIKLPQVLQCFAMFDDTYIEKLFVDAKILSYSAPKNDINLLTNLYHF